MGKKGRNIIALAKARRSRRAKREGKVAKPEDQSRGSLQQEQKGEEPGKGKGKIPEYVFPSPVTTSTAPSSAAPSASQRKRIRQNARVFEGKISTVDEDLKRAAKVAMSKKATAPTNKSTPLRILGHIQHQRVTKLGSSVLAQGWLAFQRVEKRTGLLSWKEAFAVLTLRDGLLSYATELKPELLSNFSLRAAKLSSNTHFDSTHVMCNVSHSPSMEMDSGDMRAMSQWVTIGYSHRFKARMVKSRLGAEAKIQDSSRRPTTLAFATRTAKDASRWIDAIGRWQMLRHYVNACARLRVEPDLHFMIDNAHAGEQTSIARSHVRVPHAWYWSIATLTTKVHNPTLFFASIATIKLVNVDMVDADAEPLAVFVSVQRGLRVLDLSHNRLSSTCLGHLQAMLTGAGVPTTLEELHLSNNTLGDATCTMITNVLTVLRRLKTLDISQNFITPLGMQSLATRLPDSTIKELNISGNPFGDSGAMFLAHSLVKSYTLERLHVRHCGIGEAGMQAIVEALRPGNGRHHCILKHLDCSGNFRPTEELSRAVTGIAATSRATESLGLGTVFSSSTDWQLERTHPISIPRFTFRRKDEDVLQAKKMFSKAIFHIDEDMRFVDREQFSMVIARTLQIQPTSVEICSVTSDPCTVVASMIGFNCAQRLVRLHKGGDPRLRLLHISSITKTEKSTMAIPATMVATHDAPQSLSTTASAAPAGMTDLHAQLLRMGYDVDTRDNVNASQRVVETVSKVEGNDDKDLVNTKRSISKRSRRLSQRRKTYAFASAMVAKGTHNSRTRSDSRRASLHASKARRLEQRRRASLVLLCEDLPRTHWEHGVSQLDKRTIAAIDSRIHRAAAVKLQSVARQYTAQKEFRSRLAARKLERKQNASAVRIQSVARGHWGRIEVNRKKAAAYAAVQRRQKLAKEEQAATAIQSVVRAKRGRRMAQSRRAKLEIKQEMEKRNAAAVNIQKAARGRRARVLAYQRKKAKAYAARKELKTSPPYAASQIQRIVRGRLAVKKVETIKRHSKYFGILPAHEQTLELLKVLSSRDSESVEREVEAAGKLGLDITDIIENLPSQIEAAESILESALQQALDEDSAPPLADLNAALSGAIMVGISTEILTSAMECRQDLVHDLPDSEREVQKALGNLFQAMHKRSIDDINSQLLDLEDRDGLLVTELSKELSDAEELLESIERARELLRRAQHKHSDIEALEVALTRAMLVKINFEDPLVTTSIQLFKERAMVSCAEQHLAALMKSTDQNEGDLRELVRFLHEHGAQSAILSEAEQLLQTIEILEREEKLRAKILSINKCYAKEGSKAVSDLDSLHDLLEQVEDENMRWNWGNDGGDDDDEAEDAQFRFEIDKFRTMVHTIQQQQELVISLREACDLFDMERIHDLHVRAKELKLRNQETVRARKLLYDTSAIDLDILRMQSALKTYDFATFDKCVKSIRRAPRMSRQNKQDVFEMRVQKAALENDLSAIQSILEMAKSKRVSTPLLGLASIAIMLKGSLGFLNTQIGIERPSGSLPINALLNLSCIQDDAAKKALLSGLEGDLNTSITKVPTSKLSALSVAAFDDIKAAIGIPGDPGYSEKFHHSWNMLVKTALAHNEIHDELFLQLCKVMHKNPRENSRKEGLKVFSLFARYFAPSSDEVKSALVAFLQRFPEACADEGEGDTFNRDPARLVEMCNACVVQLERGTDPEAAMHFLAKPEFLEFAYGPPRAIAIVLPDGNEVFTTIAPLTTGAKVLSMVEAELPGISNLDFGIKIYAHASDEVGTYICSTHDVLWKVAVCTTSDNGMATQNFELSLCRGIAIRAEDGMGSCRNPEDQLNTMALTYELEVHRALLCEYGTHPASASFLAELEFLAEQADENALDYSWNDVERAALEDRLVATTNANDAKSHAKRLWSVLQSSKGEVYKIRNARGGLRFAILMYLRAWPLYGSMHFTVDEFTMKGDNKGTAKVFVSGSGFRVCQNNEDSKVLLDAKLSEIAIIRMESELIVNLELTNGRSAELKTVHARTISEAVGRVVMALLRRKMHDDLPPTAICENWAKELGISSFAPPPPPTMASVVQHDLEMQGLQPSSDGRGEPPSSTPPPPPALEESGGGKIVDVGGSQEDLGLPPPPPMDEAIGTPPPLHENDDDIGSPPAADASEVFVPPPSTTPPPPPPGGDFVVAANEEFIGAPPPPPPGEPGDEDFEEEVLLLGEEIGLD